MSHFRCVAFCESKGFLYAGLEYASEVRPSTVLDRVVRCSTTNQAPFLASVSLLQCYCGSKWTSGTQAATEGSCNMVRSLIPGLLRPVSDVALSIQPCAGKISQTCGGSNRLSVYAKVSSSTSTSVSVSAPAASDTSASLPSGWQTQGCKSTVNSLACKSPLRRRPESRLTAVAGCFLALLTGVIDGSPRLLSGSYTSLKTTNTPAACIAACAAGGFSYAGTQNGDRASILAPSAAAREAHLLTERFVSPPARAECYCGSTLNASGKIGTTAADSYCQAAACPGDASQKCGGPFYMRLFKSSPVAAPSSSSAPAPTASGTATSVPSGWQSKGCASFWLMRSISNFD